MLCEKCQERIEDRKYVEIKLADAYIDHKEVYYHTWCFNDEFDCLIDFMAESNKLFVNLVTEWTLNYHAEPVIILDPNNLEVMEKLMRKFK